MLIAIDRSVAAMAANVSLFATVAWLWAVAFAAAADDSRGYIPAWPDCSKTDNYTTNSQYQLNLNHLLNDLPTEAKNNGGFYNASLGAAPDEVFALVMCYADDDWTDCENCLYAAAAGITSYCPYSRWVNAAYSPCLIRYSNASFFSTANTMEAFHFRSDGTSDDPSSMDSARRKLMMGGLVEEAARSPSPLRWANGSLPYKYSKGNPHVMYGLAQCTRDLNASECIRCLTSMVDKLTEVLPNNSSGGIKCYSCYVKYSMVSPSKIIQPPPPQSLKPPGVGTC